ncbi:hypothetical protein K438DRAFT_1946396 [Mycena galopus ATCC 62051]|nr:hypothetical protein K438DRAFT_1946396 [Mycena galopus ATCC 62051]
MTIALIPRTAEGFIRWVGIRGETSRYIPLITLNDVLNSGEIDAELSGGQVDRNHKEALQVTQEVTEPSVDTEKFLPQARKNTGKCGNHSGRQQIDERVGPSARSRRCLSGSETPNHGQGKVSLGAILTCATGIGIHYYHGLAGAQNPLAGF